MLTPSQKATFTQYEKLRKEKELLEERLDSLKIELLKVMEEEELTSYKGKFGKFSYIAKHIEKRFNSKAFQAEHAKLYEKFKTASTKEATLKYQ